MNLSITVTSQPPPHRISAGCEITRQQREVPLEEAIGAVQQAAAEALWEAFRSGLFDASGCISIVIQRASDRPSEGPGPRG